MTTKAVLLGALIDACQRFSAAHGRCKDPECTDAIVDPQDWAEFDRAWLAITGGRLPEGQQAQGRGKGR